MNPLAKLDQLNLDPSAKTEVTALLQALMPPLAHILHRNACSNLASNSPAWPMRGESSLTCSRPVKALSGKTH
jgi:hypothetical protein